MSHTAQTAQAVHAAAPSEPVDPLSPSLSELEYDIISSPSSLQRSDDDDEIVWSVPSLNGMSSSAQVRNPSSAVGSNLNEEDGSHDSSGDTSTDADTPPEINSDVSGISSGRTEDHLLIRGDGGTREYVPRTLYESTITNIIGISGDKAYEPERAIDALGIQMARLGLHTSTMSAPTRSCAVREERATFSDPEGMNLDKTKKKSKKGKSRAKSEARLEGLNVQGGEGSKKAATARAPLIAGSTPARRELIAEPGVLPIPIANGQPKKRSEDSKRSKKRGEDGHELTGGQASASSQQRAPPAVNRHAVVDDGTENGGATLQGKGGSEKDQAPDPAYEEAVKYMDEFLKNPSQLTSKESKLTFMQALIVELGIAPTSGSGRKMPTTVTAAQKLLKTHAFIHILEYLTKRKQGLDALRQVMHPTRSSLIRDLRGRRKRKAPLKWVKESGLGVLLVDCHF